MSDTTLERNAHIQNILFNAVLNSTLIGFLLLGIYTFIYCGTMYLCLNKKSAPGLVVLSTITLLYFVNAVQNGFQWFVLRTLSAPSNGEPRPFDYALMLTGSGWVNLANNICNFTLTTLADGLLIWRCYKAWGGSFRIISLSLGLLFLEIVFYISTIIIDCRNKNFKISNHLLQISNGIFSAALFTAFLTTLLTTLLIVYRINSVSRQNALSSLSSRSMRNVVNLVMQSSALYCIAVLMAAILQVIPQNATNKWTLFCLQNYLGSVFCLFAGMAPTVMVARVALAHPSAASRINAMSDLTFQTHVHFPSGLSFSSEPDEVQTQERVNCDERKSLEREIT